MLEYDRIDISDGIDVDKTDRSKECTFCHYYYFLDKNFKYGPYLSDGCYDIVKRSTDFRNITIVHIKKSAYRSSFSYINKHKAKKLIKNFIQLIRREIWSIAKIIIIIIIIVIIILIIIIIIIIVTMTMTIIIKIFF